MKTRKVILGLSSLALLSTPLAVYGFDRCQAVFSSHPEMQTELRIRELIDSDLDYTLIKSDKSGREVMVTMESATPENFHLIELLLNKWSMKFDDKSYEIFKRDFLLVRDVLEVHKFQPAINLLTSLSNDPAARLNEIALASRVKSEIYQYKEAARTESTKGRKASHELVKGERQTPTAEEAAPIARAAQAKGWSWDQLSTNISDAIDLAKKMKIEGDRFYPVIQILREERPNYLEELRAISKLRLDYVYHAPWSKDSSREVVTPDVHDAKLIIEKSEALNKPVGEVVAALEELINKTGLNSGAPTGNRIQFSNLLVHIE